VIFICPTVWPLLDLGMAMKNRPGEYTCLSAALVSVENCAAVIHLYGALFAGIITAGPRFLRAIVAEGTILATSSTLVGADNM